MEKPIEIPIKLGGLSALKKELKEIRGQIVDSTDPVEMERLAKRAGQLTDNLRDANEQINIFAGGSGFERVSNNLGDVGSKLASLDFKGAGDSAMLLANNIKSINPAEVTEQMKGLTDTFKGLGKAGFSVIGGLIKNVGAMAKSFFQMGLSLLANPIFLIGAAIAALVGIIALVLDKLGILQPILDGIGYVFGLIGDAIDYVIQQFKDFLDMIGLTDYAGEEAAKNEAARLDDITAKRKDAHNGIIRGLDEEIAIRKARGEETYDLELKKQQAIIKTAQVEFDALNFKVNNAKYLKTLSKDEIKELKNQYKESKEVLLNAKSEFKILSAQTAADKAKQKVDDAAQAKADAKERADKAKAYAKDRLDAQRLAKDLELNLLEDGFEKERRKNEENLRRQLQDIQSNAKLTADEKAKQSKLYADLAKVEEKKLVDAEAVRVKEKAITDAEKAKEEADIIKKNNDDKAAIYDDYYNFLQSLERDATVIAETERLKKFDDDVVKLDGFLANKTITQEKYDADLKTLTAQTQADLRVITADGTKAAADKTAAANQKDLDEFAKVQEAKRQLTQTMVEGIGALGSIFIKDQKKLEKLNKASALVQIGIDTALAISSLVKYSQSNPLNAVTFGSAAFAQYATGIVQILTNVAKAKALLSGGGGGGGTAPAPPPPANNTPVTPQQAATPNIGLFGGANQFNNVGSAQSVNGSNVIQAVVSETDITNSQKKINKFEQLATL